MNIIPINGKALVWGIATFCTLYTLHVVVLPWLIGSQAAGSENRELLYGISQFMGLATCLGAGYVAAHKSGHHGFVHGGIVGAVSTVITALAAMVWAIITEAKFFGLETLPFWMVINGFLGAFAGLLRTNMVEDDSQH